MIENPNVFVPGTKMALFPGLPDAKQRADVLVFLRTKNDNPPPLPEVKAGGGEEKPAGGKPGGKAAAGGAEVLALIATADPKQGEADAALCKVCHSFDKGGPAIVGPDLYGVVGRKIASVEGFNYTPALKAHEGAWTYEIARYLAHEPAGLRAGDDDGLSRHAGCEEARQHHRLPALQERQPGASAGGCGSARGEGHGGTSHARGSSAPRGGSTARGRGAGAFRRDTGSRARGPRRARGGCTFRRDAAGSFRGGRTFGRDAAGSFGGDHGA